MKQTLPQPFKKEKVITLRNHNLALAEQKKIEDLFLAELAELESKYNLPLEFSKEVTKLAIKRFGKDKGD